MTSQRRNGFASLFDLRFGTVAERNRSKGRLVILGVIGLVIVATLWLVWGWVSPGAEMIRMQVNDLEGLETGAPVVMLGVEVGQVDSIDIEDGKAVTYLSIASEWSGKIPEGSDFIICSLNLIMPGNIGVKIIPPGTKSSPTSSSSRTNQHADTNSRNYREEFADDRVLPRQTPIGFFVVGILAVIGIGLLLTMIFKIVRFGFFKLIVVLAAIALAVYFSGQMNLFPSVSAPLQSEQR